MIERDMWVDSYKVRVFPWVDNKRIYCNVRYFRPGQSIEKEPVWYKTVYITNNVAGYNPVFNFIHSLVEHIALMKIDDGKEVTLTVLN